jgi:hypothetical protein
MNNEAVQDLSARERAIIKLGGASLIVAAVGFMAVFSWLAARFHYPDVLDGRPADVLPALLAMGDTGRGVWAIYALLPMLFIPAAAGAFHALRRTNEGAVRVGSMFATISALALTIGLMRWPSFQWELAKAWMTDPSTHATLTPVFDAANTYLGNYIGEFLGELCFSLFFLASAMAMFDKQSGFPRFVAWLGMLTAVAGWIGMFRNATAAVNVFAEVNNYLLPVWMIVFGIALIRFGRARAHA